MVCTNTSTEGCRLVITGFLKANFLSDSEPQYSKFWYRCCLWQELAAPDLVTGEDLALNLAFLLREHLFEPVHHLLIPQPLVVPDLACVARLSKESL